MKISINRQALLKNLTDVQRAISSKTTIPILTGVKLVASKKGLLLSGSDTEISIETAITVAEENNQLEVLATGSIVLPARFFADIIKKMAAEIITIEVKDQFQTKISAGKASFTLNGLDAASYPKFPKLVADETFHLPAQLLKQVIQHTVVAASTQESRPILTGVNLIIADGTLRAVSTDSHRLSQRIIAIDLPKSFAGKTCNVVVPSKSLIELARIIEGQEKIDMMVTENQVLFHADAINFYTRLLEGNYPDTNRLIPDTATAVTHYEIGAHDLFNAIERAGLMSREGKLNAVKLEISAGRVELTSNSPEVGYVTEELANGTVGGEPLMIAFNPDYMKDALRTFGQQAIDICFTSPVRPFVIVPQKADDQVDGGFVQLITPIRMS